MDRDEIAAKRRKEQDTVRFMIGLYCHRKHKTKGDCLCEACQKLADYAAARVEHCPHMEDKTFCSSCKTPCYRPDMREQIRTVMRFSGPRMIFYCPQMLIQHKKAERQKKKEGQKN